MLDFKTELNKQYKLLKLLENTSDTTKQIFNFTIAECCNELCENMEEINNDLTRFYIIEREEDRLGYYRIVFKYLIVDIANPECYKVITDRNFGIENMIKLPLKPDTIITTFLDFLFEEIIIPNFKGDN